MKAAPEFFFSVLKNTIGSSSIMMSHRKDYISKGGKVFATS
jgi:hypothetical protein